MRVDHIATAAWNSCVSHDSQTEFEQRLRECHRLVYQVALGVLRDPADAEEITQDAFLKAYRKLSSLREPGKFRSWVARMSFRLALNRRRDAMRSRRRDTSWMETSQPPAEDIESNLQKRQYQERLQGQIERLPKKLKSVLLLSAVQELSTRDVAAILRIPEGTVRSRLHLARKQLLKALCDETL